jgi:hypothetical protein
MKSFNKRFCGEKIKQSNKFKIFYSHWEFLGTTFGKNGKFFYWDSFEERKTAVSK